MMSFRIFSLVTAVFITIAAGAQTNLLPLADFYKDRLFSTAGKQQYNSSYFLPASETEIPLHEIIRDSSKQYYEFGEVIFKKHVIEAKGKNYRLNISPILDFTLGKDIKDTSSRRLFQNTRGIYIEGELLKNFSFSTAIVENQARFSRYQTDFYTALGELYTNQSTGSYTQQNAVVPGAARTKPFKEDGFDYAFAMGNIHYQPVKWLSVTAGNTPSFIGAGYRSLFLSDNSLPSPFYKLSFAITKKLQFHYYRSRLLNLIRKPVSTTVESYYEPKGHSVNYIHYQFNDHFSLQLIESITWSKGDSIISKRVHPLFYNPLPVLSSLVLKQEEINTLTGLQFQLKFKNAPLIYGQVGIGNLNINSTSGQIGMRWFDAIKVKNLFVQMEYNYYSSTILEGENKRLNFSHGNVSLSHPKGNGFHEGVLRINYEWKRIYVDSKTVYYSLFSNTLGDLMITESITPVDKGPLIHQQLEIGYRINRKMNTVVFGSLIVRKDKVSEPTQSTLFSAGLRTALFNRYTDF